jgi:hypothetical protein
LQRVRYANAEPRIEPGPAFPGRAAPACYLFSSSSPLPSQASPSVLDPVLVVHLDPLVFCTETVKVMKLYSTSIVSPWVQVICCWNVANVLVRLPDPLGPVFDSQGDLSQGYSNEDKR